MTTSTFIRAERFSSSFELLPTEIHILILSNAARSPADLGSLIRTCCTIHNCFVSFKSCILISPALEDLGPVIRDALALARIPGSLQVTGTDEENLQDLKSHMQEYCETIAVAAPHGAAQRHPKSQWAADITPDLAVQVLQLNRAAELFVDLYAAIRCAYLAREPNSDALHDIMHHTPLSLTERRRLAQGFLRAELLVKVHRANMAPAHDPAHWSSAPILDTDERVLDTILEPFTAWEMEQISQAHFFIFSVCRATVFRNGVDGRFLPAQDQSDWRAHMERWRSACREWAFDMVAFRRRLVQNGGSSTCDAADDGESLPASVVLSPSSTSASVQIEKSPISTISIAPKSTPASIVDPPVPRTPLSTITSSHWCATVTLESHPITGELLAKGMGRGNGTCMATGGTHVFWLGASHRHRQGREGWPPPGEPKKPEGIDGGMSGQEPAATLLPEPYAWSDALDGRAWDRWGLDFLFEARNVNNEVRRRQEVTARFSRWRWLGFVFYDEERVQRIKEVLGDGYATGWLPGIWVRGR